MFFKFGQTYADVINSKKAKAEWHNWYAWYPVCVDEHKCVYAWFETIERRFRVVGDPVLFYSTWEYRIKENA